MADKKRNPRNAEHGLFKKLTRLFSGPIINYRRQTEHNLRRRRLVKYNFQSTSGKEFKKQNYYPFDSLRYDLIANAHRMERYNDFRQMEFMPEVNSCLDIFGDEITVSTIIDPLLTIKCPNEEIKDVLNTLYHNILNIEFNLYPWARTMCKYGDYFVYLDIDESHGVRNAIGLPTEEIERLEGEDKTNPNYVQFQWNAGGLTLENWQVAHFRILGDDKYAPYGQSVLDGARRIWRQLELIENAMLSYRIVRAPERKVFYVDVGNIAPKDVEPFMQQFMTQMKRNQVVDANTGRVDLRYNSFSLEDDYYIPVRGNVSTKIEPLPGGQYVGDIDDVKYLRDKLFSALKVPQSYLTRAEGGSEDKTSLAQKDIFFARTIQRLQRAIVAELEKIGIIHLYILGYREEDLISFSLSLNNPSKLAELQDLEHWRTKFDVAGAATEGFFSKRWIGEKIFNMSEEDIVRNQREMYYDMWLAQQLSSIEESENELGGDLGNDFGEDLEGGEELGTEEEDEEGAEEESTLLATPAKRDDEPYLTPGAKGKFYTKVKDDKRDMGARKRHLKGKYNDEKKGSSKRSTFPGFGNLNSLVKGIAENKEKKDSNYEKEEKELIKQHNAIRVLVEELDRIPKKEEENKLDLESMSDKLETILKLSNKGK